VHPRCVAAGWVTDTPRSAYAYTAKRDYDRAIQDFDQSIKLDPTYTEPFNNRGVAYLKKGEYDLAIKAFDEAIRLNPSYGEVFANRAGAYLKKNENDRAARDYDEAIRLAARIRFTDQFSAYRDAS
jgi:tetratricopeptide (TPR) repeat protein